MGSSLRKGSANRKDETDKRKQPIKEESVQEEKLLDEKEEEKLVKENEEDEEVSSYLEIEEETYPQNNETAGFSFGSDQAMAPRALFGSSSKSKMKSSCIRVKSGNLYAKVGKFQYQLPDNEALLKAKYSWPIAKKSIIDNKSAASISCKVNYNEAHSDTFVYEFAHKFMNTFDEIELDKSMPLTIELNGVKYYLDTSSAMNTYSPRTANDDKYFQTYIIHNNFSIEESINIPANSSVQAQAYQEKLKNLIIPFSAEMVIFRQKGNKRFSGESIKKYLKKLNLTIISVDDKSITAQVNGKLRVDFGLETLYKLNSFNTT